jgi:protein-disulfide isomerase
MEKRSFNFKSIAIAVLISQVVTIGGALIYKSSTGSPLPGFGYSVPEMQAFVGKGIEEGIVAQEQSRVDAEVAKLFKKFEMAPESTPNNTHIYGDLRGRFTLAEFSDLECGFCKRLHPTLKEIVDRSSGAVNWQWRHLPLGFHNPSAQSAGHGAECYSEQKGNRGFWVFIDQWFEHSRMNGEGVKNISDFAVSIGADREKFDSCTASGKYEDLIEKNKQMADKVGATGTPATVIVDNLTGAKEFISGAQSSKAFVTVMKKMIAEGEAKEAEEKAKAEGRPFDALSNVLGASGSDTQAVEQKEIQPAGAKPE